MRIQGMGGMVGGVDTSQMADRIMEVERAPVEAVKERRGRVVAQKNEYSALSGLLGDLGNVAGKLKLPGEFRQLAFQSSHPDILEGVVDGAAVPGTYEFEVRGLAAADKHLAAGFPDRDKTEVGFGFMQIEHEGGKLSDVIIKPGATLDDVMNTINSANAGVRAQVVNTGFPEEPFRLEVVSNTTGEAAKLHLDPDTTFLDFKNIKAARNLDVQFDDVGVTRPGNKLDDLLDGVKMSAKRAEPGTRIQVSIAPDVDKTFANIKGFTDKYNSVAGFLGLQFQVDAATHKPGGNLAGDGNMRTMMRNLQSEIGSPLPSGGKYRSLSEVGISTNAKSGQLEVDEKKLRGALESDYDGVAKLFTLGEAGGDGVAARVTRVLDRFKDPVSGVMPNRMRSLDTMIHDQDKQIENQTRRLDDRHAALQQQLSAMSSKVDALNVQGEFLSARFGGDAAAAAPASGGKGG